MEKEIYHKLRAAKNTHVDVKSEDLTDREVRRQRTVGEYEEHFKEFSISDIKKLLYDESIAKRFIRIIGQGKEANVYWIKDFQNQFAAIKHFRVNTSSHNFNQYHSRSKLSDTAKLGIAIELSRTEYQNLVILYENKIRVPKPIKRYEFFFSMEYLGNKRGCSPLLKDVNLKHEERDVIDYMDEILDQVDKMFNSNAMMVHGDLSEHNIMFHEGEIYLIDFLQSQRYHPRFETSERIKKRDALPILKYDIYNVLDYFKKTYRISYDPEKVYQQIAGKLEDTSPDRLMNENFDIDNFEGNLKNG